MLVEGIGALAVAVWLYLAFARGGFWLCKERDERAPAPLPVRLPSWPSITVVIPARNEAACIADTVISLLGQDYAGAWKIILVDDDSNDGTADIARRAAASLGVAIPLDVIRGQPLPRGWTGKLWAVRQGIESAKATASPPDYILMSDADIVYAPRVLTSLVTHAVAGRFVLASLMVKLRCESLAERGLIPAFIFFFQMLYPFPWVNRPNGATAAAAGGCMLVRSDALKAAGGIDSIRNALIDDCSLAKLLKAQGPIWLGLTERVHSTRAYAGLEDIRRMVARSAYAQLRYSPLLLAGTVAGMALTYVAPPALAIFASGTARWLGLVAWGLMALIFQPTLRLYRRSPLWGAALPAIALCYMLFTLDSALQYVRGKGGLWKGARPGHGTMTNDPAALRSGKGHRDENFPVASRLIQPRYRGAILAFYEFVRVADDISDHATLGAQEKLALLDQLEAGLLGHHDEQRQAVTLRTVLRERNLSPHHAQDLLTAFRMDVTKLRYRDWDDLMGYCSYSAMPVGRYVLDVHGEDRAIWPANDALCAALQVINHLQDCSKDFRTLDRVYVPQDALAAAGATTEDLGREAASPALRQCLVALARRTGALLDDSAVFSARIKNYRLAMEVAVIQSLARRLVALLMRRDPLSERVHLGTGRVAGAGVLGIIAGTAGRFSRVLARPQATRNA